MALRGKRGRSSHCKCQALCHQRHTAVWPHQQAGDSPVAGLFAADHRAATSVDVTAGPRGMAQDAASRVRSRRSVVGRDPDAVHAGVRRCFEVAFSAPLSS